MYLSNQISDTRIKIFQIKIMFLLISEYCNAKVVGDVINTVKTTFDFNFDLYQAVKPHGYS